MPTSHPWNPNHIRDTTVCHDCCGWGCKDCNGKCEFQNPERPYREDQKIRCSVGTPAGQVKLLFWDEAMISNFRSEVISKSRFFSEYRGWDGSDISLIPEHVVYIQRNDQ